MKRKWRQDAAITVIVAGATALSLTFFPSTEPSNTVKKTALGKNITEEITGKAVVTDGDTIILHDTVIRFHGIDAPEINQPCWTDEIEYACGLAAKRYLQRLINDQPIRCHLIDRDSYGRALAKCRNYQNIDINAQMVSSGNAIAYLFFSDDYAAQQAEAKTKKNGIWNGRFIEPYHFRKL